MNRPIGSIGPGGAAGPANIALEQADTVVDFAETEPGYAAVLLEAMNRQPSPAARERLAEDTAQPTDADAGEQNDGSPSAGGPALDMAQLAPSIAGIFERGQPAPSRRLLVEGGQSKKLDRRRKRSC